MPHMLRQTECIGAVKLCNSLPHELKLDFKSAVHNKKFLGAVPSKLDGVTFAASDVQSRQDLQLRSAGRAG